MSNNQQFVECPNGDVFKLHAEGKITPGTKIYFDGRLQALGLIERFYGDNFYLLSEHNKKVNVIERKDNEVKRVDVRKEYYEKAGYFS